MEPSLSPYWRIDQSDLPTEDQSSILDGAIKAVSLLGINVPVRWERSFPSSYDKKTIALDVRWLEINPSPLPGKWVDALIGQALHQAGHIKWSSFFPALLPQWRTLTPNERSQYLVFYHLWEDCFIHLQLTQLSLTPALYNEKGSVISSYQTLFSFLRQHLSQEKQASFLSKIEEKASFFSSLQNPEERCLFTASFFLECKDFLTPLAYPLLSQPENPLSPFPFSSAPHSKETNSFSPGGAAPGKKGSLHLQSVSKPEKAPASVISNIRDFSQQVAGIGLFEASVSVKNARYNEQQLQLVQKEVGAEAARLRSFFLHLDSMAYSWKRATPHGKVDRRRLSLAATGKETIFKQKIITSETSLGMVLLMDVSASMRGFLQYVNRAAAIFAEALRPLVPKIWYEILTYTGDGYSTGADVQITRLATPKKRLSLDDIWLEGGTPTAPAIATAALLLKNTGKKKKIIIHFTDGRPKDNLQVLKALSFCKQNHIDVVTISVNDPQGHLYGVENSIIIKKIADLPEAASSVLMHLF